MIGGLDLGSLKSFAPKSAAKSDAQAQFGNVEFGAFNNGGSDYDLLIKAGAVIGGGLVAYKVFKMIKAKKSKKKAKSKTTKRTKKK